MNPEGSQFPGEQDWKSGCSRMSGWGRLKREARGCPRGLSSLWEMGEGVTRAWPPCEASSPDPVPFFELVYPVIKGIFVLFVLFCFITTSLRYNLHTTK